MVERGHCAIEVYIVWYALLSPTGHVILQLDERFPNNTNWDISEDGDAMFYPDDGKEYIGWMMGHSVLKATASQLAGLPRIEAVFDLSGIDLVGPKIMERC